MDTILIRHGYDENGMPRLTSGRSAGQKGYASHWQQARPGMERQAL